MVKLHSLIQLVKLPREIHHSKPLKVVPLWSIVHS